MLHEIGHIRQDSDRGLRRWFQDDYFDLYTWQDANGALVAFQLCYQRNRDEGVVSWTAAEGFSHARVDSGEHPFKHARSPLLRSDGTPPFFRIYSRFLDATRGFEAALREPLLERLREYRGVLFGRRRKPRRKPCVLSQRD